MRQHRRDEPLTLEEYASLDEDGRYRSELSRGLLVREPRPGALHARIALELGLLLREYVKQHDLGSVEVESGFRLSTDPLSVRGPDVAFVRKERLPAEVPTGWWPFAPDLAVEITSPSTTLSRLQEKIFEYFDAGTHEVWVIDPPTRCVTVYRSLSDISIVREPGTLEGGELLPGLVLQLDSFLGAARL